MILRENIRMLLEGSHPDTDAAKILTASGLFDEDTSKKIIQALYRGEGDNHGDLEALSHLPREIQNSFPKYLKTIARMIVSTCHTKDEAVHFLEEKIPVMNEFITWAVMNYTSDEYKNIQSASFNSWTMTNFEEFVTQKRREIDQASDEVLSNSGFSGTSSYTIIPIDSYQEMHQKFGGSATGDGKDRPGNYAGAGGTSWCHTNSPSVYNSWVKNGKFKFYVIAAKNWKDIKAKDYAGGSNPKDDYGNSLIAILVSTTTGVLVHNTLRWNHVKGGNADNQYKDYAELSQVVGFNVKAYISKNIVPVDMSTITKLTSEIVLANFADLEEITIPNSVTEIGDRAFSGCTSLTSITIPNSVTEIGEFAFCDCTSLTSITIPNSVTSIRMDAFKGCTSLTSITIPNSVTRIGYGAFSYCTSLKSITIPDSVTEIGEFAFRGTSLTSITIPNSVTSIRMDAFKGCTSLTSITIPNSVTRIGYGAFKGCTSLTSITIPNSVTEIGEFAFRGCTSLTSITIPNSVTRIGYGAFYDCTSLQSITIPNSVTRIGIEAFKGCTSLSLRIPSDLDIANIGVRPEQIIKESFQITFAKCILENAGYIVERESVLGSQQRKLRQEILDKVKSLGFKEEKRNDSKSNGKYTFLMKEFADTRSLKDTIFQVTKFMRSKNFTPESTSYSYGKVEGSETIYRDKNNIRVASVYTMEGADDTLFIQLRNSRSKIKENNNVRLINEKKIYEYQ